MTVAGIVVARQRPGTAKGYVFVLMEDEDGPINVIVKPDIYERDRIVVRMEPFLLITGRLQKDGGTMNVIASEIRPLKAEPTPRNGELRTALPDTLEYWGRAGTEVVERARLPTGSSPHLPRWMPPSNT